MNLANEGLEARKKEEEVAAKKRKAEEDANWEGTSATFPTLPRILNLFRRTAGRESRVGSWRTFASSSKKKKKTKGAVLG